MGNKVWKPDSHCRSCWGVTVGADAFSCSEYWDDSTKTTAGFSCEAYQKLQPIARSRATTPFPTSDDFPGIFERCNQLGDDLQCCVHTSYKRFSLSSFVRLLVSISQCGHTVLQKDATIQIRIRKRHVIKIRVKVLKDRSPDGRYDPPNIQFSEFVRNILVGGFSIRVRMSNGCRNTTQHKSPISF